MSQPEEPKSPGLSIPSWGWFFAFASGLLPAITFGGLVSFVLGLSAMGLCLSVARKSHLPVETRVAICLGVTALCWVFLMAPMIGMAILSS